LLKSSRERSKEGGKEAPVLRFIKTLLQRAAGEYLRDDCGQLAAAISYFTIFAVFPLLIFVVAISALVIQDPGVQEDIVDEVLNNIPLSEGEGRDSVRDAVQGVGEAGEGALGILGLIGLAWAGSSLFGALRRGLNAAFDDTETKRPFVPQKAIDLALVLALAVFFLASIGATALFRIARNASAELGALGDLAEATGLLWDAASYAIPLFFSLIAFTALYCVVPSRLRSPLEVWPGAIIAAVLFEAAKLGFSFYLENFTSYDVVMGSLGAAAGFLFWIYVSANIMLFGAEVAAEYPRVPESGYKQPVMEGLKLPLTQRAWNAFRGLFVSPRKPDAGAEDDAASPGQTHEPAATRRDAPRA
jgi:membrane protein